MRYNDPKIEILLFDEDEILTESTTAKDEALGSILGSGTNAAVSIDINRLTINTIQ